MSGRMVVTFQAPEDVHQSQPWPVGLAPEPVRGYPDITRWVVTSGLGPDDDGATLVGFGPVGKQHITVLPDAAVADPSTVVGLAPTFSDGDGFFEWAIAIAELTVQG